MSFTQLMTYVRCPEHYLFRYVLGFKRVPRKALKHGFSIHETIAYHFDRKKEDAKGLKLVEAQEFFVDVFENALEDYKAELEETKSFLPREYLAKEKEVKVGELIDKGIRGIEAYFKELAPRIKPDIVEGSFEVPVRKSLKLVGRIDLTDTKNTIHELKTTSKSPRMQDIQFDPQLALYQLGFETLKHTMPSEIHKEYIVFGKKDAKIAHFQVARPFLNKAVVLRYICAIMDAIERRIFYCLHPAESWICSKEWCGYYKFHRELQKFGLEKFIAKYKTMKWENHT